MKLNNFYKQYKEQIKKIVYYISLILFILFVIVLKASTSYSTPDKYKKTSDEMQNIRR